MGLGLSLRTGGGDLITGGDSAGEFFSEYTFNLVNSLIFPSAREVHTLLHLLQMLVMLANNCSPPLCLLALEASNQLKKP